MNVDMGIVMAALVVLVIWSWTERAIHMAGLRQTGSAQREWASSITLVMTFLVLAVYSAVDALNVHWTALGPGHAVVRGVGLLVLLAGAGVRVVARIHLGRAFSGFVQTNESHRLVSSGIYAHLRHPAYLGSLLVFLGFPLATGSMGGLAVAVVVGIPAIVYRIRIEERALVGWFGEEYAGYQARTWRVVPWIW